MLTAQSFVPVTPDVRAFMSRAGLQAPHDSTESSQQVMAVSRSPDEIAQIRSRQERFFRAMEDFKNQPGNQAAVTTFDIRSGHHSWASVLATANIAAQNYESKSKGLKNMFTRLGRNFGQQQALIETFLSILPCGEYTSIACGGVKLLFAACGRMNQIREDVINALNEAPYYLEQAEALQTIYRGDQKLASLTDTLYLALLNAIEGMIEWFGHRTRDRFSVVIKQDAYGGKYQTQICNVQVSSKMLLDHAEMLDKSTTVLNQQITLNVLGNVEIMLQQNGHLYQKLMDIYAQNNEHNQQLKTDFHHLSTDIASLKASQALHQSSLEVKFAKFLAATEHKFLWEQRVSEILKGAELRIAQVEAEKREMMQLMMVLKPEEILGLLNDAGRVSDAHLEDLVGLSRTINESPNLAEAITSSHKFMDWLSSDASQMLFIDPRGSLTTPSPGSFVTAILAQSLRRRPHAIVLKHFCAEYENLPSEQFVPALLASLICQLLATRSGWDFTAWSKLKSRQDHESLLQEQDLKYLCSLFKCLVSQVHFGTIFVFIDDFHRLERYAIHWHLQYLHQKLREALAVCPTQEAPARILKILFMTANPSLGGVISRDVSPEDMLRLDLPDDDEFGGMFPDQMQHRLGVDDDDEFQTGFVDMGMPQFL